MAVFEGHKRLLIAGGGGEEGGICLAIRSGGWKLPLQNPFCLPIVSLLVRTSNIKVIECIFLSVQVYIRPVLGKVALVGH